MPLAPDTPFPKLAGHVVRSKDWNDLVAEVQRLDAAKVNRAGDTIVGPLTVQDVRTVGPARPVPGTRLRVFESAAPAVLRIQSGLAFGPARLELWSDPPGSSTEWRPGYIQSFDGGGFTGGLSFVTNGQGAAQRVGQVEAMRLVNGRVGIGVITASPVARLHVTDNASPAVLRVQSMRPSGAARLEMWSDPQGSANEWRPGYIQSFDAGAPGGFTGGLSFVTNGSGVTQRHGNVEAMRVVNGRVGIGAMTASPAARLHVTDTASPAVLRIQSAAASGAGRLEMWSDQQGSANEWRTGYIQGFDAGAPGGFIGGLSFVTNGAGAAQRQGEVAAMRLVNGRVGIGAVVSPAARLHVVDNAAPAVVRIQSTLSFGAARMEMWSDSQGSATEWRPGYITSFDAGAFTGGLAFVTNGSGAAQREGDVEAMRLVNGRVGIGVAGPGFKVDIGDRIRLRQGPSGDAGMWLFQTGLNADRAFFGMQGNNLVGLWGAGIGWGLNMDVTTGNLGVRSNPGAAYALYVNGDAFVTGRWRDNKARSEIATPGQVSISSLSDVVSWNVVPSMSISVLSPPSGASFLVRFNMNGVQVTGVPQAHAEFRLLLDGGQIDYTMHDFSSDGWNLRGVSLGRMIWLAAGTHTLVMYWSVRSPHARPGNPLLGIPEVRVFLSGCTSLGELRFLSAIEL